MVAAEVKACERHNPLTPASSTPSPLKGLVSKSEGTPEDKGGPHKGPKKS